MNNNDGPPPGKVRTEEPALTHFRSSHEDSRWADVPNWPPKGLHATNLTPALPVVSFNHSFHALPPAPAEVTSAPTRVRIQSKETPRTKTATAATSLREKPPVLPVHFRNGEKPPRNRGVATFRLRPPPEHRQHLHETIACIRQAPVTTERAASVATASGRRPSRTTRPRKVPLSGTGANSPRQRWTLEPRCRHGGDWDWERGQGGGERWAPISHSKPEEALPGAGT
jgi:hypothetical protein